MKITPITEKTVSFSSRHFIENPYVKRSLADRFDSFDNAFANNVQLVPLKGRMQKLHLLFKKIFKLG